MWMKSSFHKSISTFLLQDLIQRVWMASKESLVKTSKRLVSHYALKIHKRSSLRLSKCWERDLLDQLYRILPTDLLTIVTYKLVLGYNPAAYSPDLLSVRESLATWITLQVLFKLDLLKLNAKWILKDSESEIEWWKSRKLWRESRDFSSLISLWKVFTKWIYEDLNSTFTQNSLDKFYKLQTLDVDSNRVTDIVLTLY